MKLILSFLIVLCGMISYSQTIFLSSDVALAEIRFQQEVMHAQAQMHEYDRNRQTVKKSDPIADIDIDHLYYSVVQALHLEDDVQKSVFADSIENTLLYVVLDEQLVSKNAIYLPMKMVRKMARQGKIGLTKNVIQQISYKDGCYYWKDEKIAGLLVLNYEPPLE